MQKSDRIPVEPGAGPVRGRPRAFDRAAALGEAMRLFWANGYVATSLADLTRAMGIGSPSLYAAFGSKAALYAEAVERYAAEYDARVWAGFEAAGSARAAMAELLSATATLLSATEGRTDPAGCMVLLAMPEGEGQAALAEGLRARRAGVLARIAARLQRAVEEGELPASSDVGAMARFYHAVQGGLSLQARDGASAAELAGAARAAMAGWDALAAN